MRYRRTWVAAAAAVIVVALAALGAACDDDENGGDGTSTAPAATEPAGTTSTPENGAPTEAPDDGAAAGLEIEAEGIAYSTDALQAPAGQAFAVAFTNNDDGIPHTFSIYASEEAADADEDPLASTGQVTGPAEETLDVEALEAGEYYFQCDVHPSMNGTLTVQ
jgi:plastocyanin